MIKLTTSLLLGMIVFTAQSAETMDGMYYCEESGLVGVEDGTGKAGEYRGGKFKLKIEGGTLTLEGGSSFNSIQMGGEFGGEVVINLETEWAYGKPAHIFTEFRLKEDSFVLIMNNNNKYLLSTGTCLKW